MNIFVLDNDPIVAAQHHCDKHVVKMVLESAQMLCTVFYMNGSGENVPYKKAHAGHPCTKWAAASVENYKWLLALSDALSLEYSFRYGKLHKSDSVIRWCAENLGRLSFQSDVQTPFAVAMPDFCKVSDDPVKCYRFYYAKVKKKFAKWKHGAPSWYARMIEEMYGER